MTQKHIISYSYIASKIANSSAKLIQEVINSESYDQNRKAIDINFVDLCAAMSFLDDGLVNFVFLNRLIEQRKNYMRSEYATLYLPEHRMRS